ncbi:ethanolamine-phosphate cytidylyltransferase-like [Lineus longissimus]|uniref:ethanolamine-phosphate cytidylyltransferase-like n=1 Tax=Lineus longissimus TaxID=88925 RepID=UPI002B4C4365
MDRSSSSIQGKKLIRLYMDGCFDVTHYGHANATRQAKQHGDCLIVGVHPDAEIATNKGPPVFTQDERYRIVRAFRWVDEVLEDAPFNTPIQLLKELDIDFHVHGDDISISAETGLDSNAAAKSAGLYMEVKRTKSISTTDLVGRILLVTKAHHVTVDDDMNTTSGQYVLEEGRCVNPNFLATSKMIADFAPRNVPKPGDRIVYTAGAFDLMHAGHVDFLEAAAGQGDFLIVGIHSDAVVNRCKGTNYPIMNLHERVLATLSFKYVDEVIIGAPYILSEAIMDELKIDIVVHGRTDTPMDLDGQDPYQAAKSRGCYKIVDSGSSLTTDRIIQRIMMHCLEYKERNRKSEEKFKRQEELKAKMMKDN